MAPTRGHPHFPTKYCPWVLIPLIPCYNLGLGILHKLKKGGNIVARISSPFGVSQIVSHTKSLLPLQYKMRFLFSDFYTTPGLKFCFLNSELLNAPVQISKIKFLGVSFVVQQVKSLPGTLASQVSASAWELGFW